MAKPYSPAEIDKVKELKRLKLFEKISLLSEEFRGRPKIGDWIFAREAPEGFCALIESENIFLKVSETRLGEDEKTEGLWLPRFDDLIEISALLKISFAQITDYMHRRRFADGREREGLLQLLIEHLR